MGNGPLEEQGKNLGEYFYYSAGLDEKDSWLKLEEIESHLQRKRWDIMNFIPMIKVCIRFIK